MATESYLGALWRRLTGRPPQAAPAGPVFGGAAAQPPTILSPAPPPEPPRPPVPLAPTWTDEALEASIDAAPQDLSRWMVWSDALQEHGDVRGELIARHREDHFGFRIETLPRVFGSLSPLIHNGELELTWRHGLPQAARIKARADLPGVTAELLRLPVSRFLDQLSWGIGEYSGATEFYADVLETLREWGRGERLRSLFFGDFERDDLEISWAQLADFTGLPSIAPRLEHLHLRGASERPLWQAADFPALTSFVLETGGLTRDMFQSVLTARMPRLQRLDLWTGDPDYGANVGLDELAPVLDGTRFEHLIHLGLCNSIHTPGVLDRLARSPLMRRLRVLDVSSGVLQSQDVDALLAHREVFLPLERFDLSRNLLDDASVARLAAALPNAKLSAQRHDWFEDDGRYVAVGE